MALLGAYQRRTLLWASGLHLCLRKLLPSGGLISLFVLSVWECTHILFPGKNVLLSSLELGCGSLHLGNTPFHFFGMVAHSMAGSQQRAPHCSAENYKRCVQVQDTESEDRVLSFEKRH